MLLCSFSHIRLRIQWLMVKLDKRTYVRYNGVILNKREADMDDKFIKELREISRDDRRRSEFMIQGMKETLEERKQQNILKRWIRRKKAEKKISQRFNPNPHSDQK